MVIKIKFYGYANLGEAYYCFRGLHGYAMTRGEEKHYVGRRAFQLKEQNHPRNAIDLNAQFYVGKTYFDKSEQTQILKIASKCHDYTAAYLYYISADKHLAYMITILLRWYSWIAIGLSCLVAVAIPDTRQLKIVLNCLWLSYYAWDVYNYSDDWLQKNSDEKKKKFKNFEWYEYLLDVSFIVCYFFLVYYTLLENGILILLYFVFISAYFAYYFYKGEVKIQKMALDTDITGQKIPNYYVVLPEDDDLKTD